MTSVCSVAIPSFWLRLRRAVPLRELWFNGAQLRLGLNWRPHFPSSNGPRTMYHISSHIIHKSLIYVVESPNTYSTDDISPRWSGAALGGFWLADDSRAVRGRPRALAGFL